MQLDISKKTTQNKKSNYTRVKKSVVNNQKRTQQFRVMADKKETIVNLVYWYVIGTINRDITSEQLRSRKCSSIIKCIIFCLNTTD